MQSTIFVPKAEGMPRKLRTRSPVMLHYKAVLKVSTSVASLEEDGGCSGGHSSYNSLCSPSQHKGLNWIGCVAVVEVFVVLQS